MLRFRFALLLGALPALGVTERVPLHTTNPIVYNMVYRRAALPLPYDIVQDHILFLNNNPLLLAHAGRLNQTQATKLLLSNIFTARATFFPFWLEAKTALTWQPHWDTELETPKMHLDNTLLYVGYDFIAQPLSQLSVYGFAGFPGSKDDPQISRQATGHWSVAVGCDAAYGSLAADNPDISYALIANARLMRLFSRIVNFENKNSLLIQNSLKHHPGNFADLLIGAQCSLCNHHLEIGYDLTINFNGKVQYLHATSDLEKPFYDEGVGHGTKILNNFYINYSYTSLWYELPVSLGGGTSYEFACDHGSKTWAIWTRTSISW